MPKPSKTELAIRHIQAHWREGKNLKEVAELYHLDAGNLDRVFRNQNGVTVKQFVDQCRKEYVLARLAGKTVVGYALGAELGFANDLAFYRWVKRVFGVSFVELRSRMYRRAAARKRNKK